jgi:HlyD family secretion protein
VLIDITSPQAQWQALGDGCRVSVRIVSLSEAQVVQVPVSAVCPMPSGTGGTGAAAPAGSAAEDPARTAAQGRFAVFVAEEGHARQTAVELGARNGTTAWIRSGITPGQQVIAYPPANVREGLRVAAHKP